MWPRKIHALLDFSTHEAMRGSSSVPPRPCAASVLDTLGLEALWLWLWLWLVAVAVARLQKASKTMREPCAEQLFEPGQAQAKTNASGFVWLLGHTQPRNVATVTEYPYPGT